MAHTYTEKCLVFHGCEHCRYQGRLPEHQPCTICEIIWPGGALCFFEYTGIRPHGRGGF